MFLVEALSPFFSLPSSFSQDIRRQIFVVIIGSEDYVDCVEKLLHLNLKGRQAQEIQKVLMECALQQRIYNPYFALVARRLAEIDKNHRLTLQFAVWDKLKVRFKVGMDLVRRGLISAPFFTQTISELSTTATAHLMRLLATLVATEVLSLSVLKVIDFVHLDEAYVFPLQLFFATLLTRNPEGENGAWNGVVIFLNPTSPCFPSSASPKQKR